MEKRYWIYLLIIVAILAAVIYVISNWKKWFPSSGQGSGQGGSGSGSGTLGGGIPTQGKTLKDFTGNVVKAKFNGTKLYDNDLNVVATYDAGQEIGWLGFEATGYFCCTNRPGFYKIYDVKNAPNGGVTGFCQCEAVMSDAALKQIFGI